MGPQLNSQLQNERLPIQLSKCKKMIISNRHLRELYNDPQIKKKLIAVLVEMTKEEVFSLCLNKDRTGNENSDIDKNPSGNAFKESEILYIPFSNDSWKCRLCISWNEIKYIRDWMSGIETHIGRTNWNKCEKLMIRTVKFNKKIDNKRKEIVELLDSDAEEDQVLKDEKNLTFRYEQMSLCPTALNVHVYSKT